MEFGPGTAVGKQLNLPFIHAASIYCIPACTRVSAYQEHKLFRGKARSQSTGTVPGQGELWSGVRVLSGCPPDRSSGKLKALV